MKQLTITDYIKIAKYTIGAVVSILIANLLHVEYAMAAGIIALLTIQDTKKETVKVTIKRITIFVIMTILSRLVFPSIGYTVWAFGIVLVPYLFFCLLFDMKEAIAPIAVLCTHYVSSKSCSLSMILNEVLILIIGAGIGILINLFMQNNLERVRMRQYEIDVSMRKILERMSIYILNENKKEYTGSCFDELEHLLSSLKKESLQYMNNHFIGTNDYFYNYMQMRLSQCMILKQIYGDIIKLNHIPPQAYLLSDLIKKISLEYHEINDAVGLLSYIETVQSKLRNEPLPTSRREFEDRAVLYHILMDIELFIALKNQFASNLTTEEKQKYWKSH